MGFFKPIKNFFGECDMFSAPATLRIKEDTGMKSFTMGFLSFLVGACFVYLFISNCLQLINYEIIDHTLTRTV
jgi:hypothetical protein